MRYITSMIFLTVAPLLMPCVMYLIISAALMEWNWVLDTENFGAAGFRFIAAAMYTVGLCVAIGIEVESQDE